MTPGEASLRASLGIPPEAQRVLVIGESSHWDTNWLETSAQYFASRVQPILLAVLDALEADPQRVYCVESLFFFQRFWDAHPDRHEQLRRLMAERRLRLLASSLTTPDTLLPHPEAVLRDFQLGHEWLRAKGLPESPSTAYFPDNFGHSPHLPSLLNAVGVRAVGLTRIDGMYFVGADYRGRGAFPLPGSTAELLEKQHQSHDFLWRDDGGGEVLCHWNAHTYFQGDMLAHVGVIRWSGKTFGVPWRTRGHIARRIKRYVAQLEPWARSPYLFCPIGMDFNDPIDDLRGLLDRYNREEAPRTGTFVLLGGLDDYFALLEHHRAALPVLQADPNPYWMGFLATRPEVKQRPMRITRTLLLAEKLAAAKERDEQLEQLLGEAWNTLVLSNHHDYIPGTSPDAVWHGEQKPWLDEAEAKAQQALARAMPPGAVAPEAKGELTWHDDGEHVFVKGPHYRFRLARSRGGCLESFEADGQELLKGPGLDLVLFHDEGGLWRLGHEFAGGRFAEVDRASLRSADVAVHAKPGELVVEIRALLKGHRFVRELICHADQPFVRVRVAGVAPARTTVTCRSDVVVQPEALEMDTLGGVVQRPHERQYSPTFWPVRSRLSLRSTHELHALFESPTAVSLSPEGHLQWIVARNALKERAFGLLPVLAHPIGGTNEDLQVHEAALLPLRAGVGLVTLAEARRDLELRWLPVEHRAASQAAEDRVRCDTPGVHVVALKRAASGEGVVLRVYCDQVPEAPVHLTFQDVPVHEAALCDALERPLAPLEVDAPGQLTLSLTRRLTTVRVR